MAGCKRKSWWIFFLCPDSDLHFQNHPIQHQLPYSLLLFYTLSTSLNLYTLCFWSILELLVFYQMQVKLIIIPTNESLRYLYHVHLSVCPSVDKILCTFIKHWNYTVWINLKTCPYVKVAAGLNRYEVG